MSPLPPADLDRRALPLLALPRNAILCRFHTHGPARHDPLHFATDRSGRLNAPDASYGTLYVAARPDGAFVESFLRSPGATTIDRGFLALKAFARLRSTAALQIADLTGPGLAQIGATNEIMAGPLPYDVPQAWSKALYLHPAGLDGVAYRARHDPGEICYALFDRCRTRIAVKAHETDLDQPWFWDLMDRYTVGLTP